MYVEEFLKYYIEREEEGIKASPIQNRRRENILETPGSPERYHDTSSLINGRRGTHKVFSTPKVVSRFK
jgi:hypothetical protein